MKVTNMIEKLERVSNKIEDILLAAFGPKYQTQEEIYRLHKKMEMNNQIDLNFSAFEDLNEQESFVDMPSMIDLNETRKFKKSTVNINTIDLKKQVRIGKCRIEIGELIEIFDKNLPGKKAKQNEIKVIKDEGSPVKYQSSHNSSNCYSPCIQKDNEKEKDDYQIRSNSFFEESSVYESPERNESFLIAKEEYYDRIDTKEKLIECLKYPLSDNMLKKFKRILIIIKNLIQDQKMLLEISRRDENQDMNISLNNQMNKSVVYRRVSIFENIFTNDCPDNDNSTSINDCPFLKTAIKEFHPTKVTSNYFADKRKKKGNKKRRNSLAGGRLCNKLKQLNMQLNADKEKENQKFSERIPKSEIPNKQKVKGEEDYNELSLSKNMLGSEQKEKKIYSVRRFLLAGMDVNPGESFSKFDPSKEIGEYRINKEIKEGPIFGGISEVKQKRGSSFFDPNQFNEINNFIDCDQENNNGGVIKEKDVEEEISSDSDSDNSDSENEDEEREKEEEKEKDVKEEDIGEGNPKNEEGDEGDEDYEDSGDGENDSDDNDDDSEKIQVNSSICFDKLN